MKKYRWLVVFLGVLSLILGACTITRVEAPTVNLPSSDSMAGGGELNLSGTGAPRLQVRVLLDDQVVGTSQVGDDGTWSLKLFLADLGEHELRLQTVSYGGTVLAEAEPITLSLAPPVVETEQAAPLMTPPTLNLPAGGAGLQAGAVALTGAGEPGSKVQVLVDGQVAGDTQVADDGNWSLALSLAEPGEHVLTLQTLDAAGIVVIEAEPVVLSLAPAAEAGVEIAAPTLDLPASGAELQAGPLTLTGAGTPSLMVQVLADGEIVGITQVADDGTWSLETSMLEPGEHELRIQSFDAFSGDMVAEAEPISVTLAPFVVEATPPTLNLPAGAAELQVGAVALSGAGTPGSVIQVMVDDQVAGTAQVGGDGTWSLKIAVIEPGEHQLTVQTLDASGAVAAEAEPVTLSLAPAPPGGIAPDLLFPAEGADIITGDTITGELTVIATGQPGSQVELLDGSAVLSMAEVGDDGIWRYTFAPELGEHEFAVHPAGDPLATSRAVLVRVAKPRDGIDCNSNPGIPGDGSYIVGTCDTLSGISRELGVGLDAVIEANPQIEDPDWIFPGESVVIPK